LTDGTNGETDSTAILNQQEIKVHNFALRNVDCDKSVDSLWQCDSALQITNRRLRFPVIVHIIIFYFKFKKMINIVPL
jgi:hypothetical protein